MLVVANITDENYRLCPEYYQGDLVISQIVHAVKHGVDLDTIKAEITHERNAYEKANNPWGDRWDYTNPYDRCLQIINNHINGDIPR